MSETVFNKVDYTLGSLLGQIELGGLALPDIQRPFVWKNAKVRDLFDSLYRGYPVGYFLFWATSVTDGVKQIGADKKQLTPNLLIVDGQQRLTGLYAVVKGVPVVREDYSEERIEIAFCPLDGTFEVADAATRNDPEYLPSISSIWAKGANLFQIAGQYVARLKQGREAAGQELSQEEIERAQTALNRLQNLQGFPFTALVLSSAIDEAQVGEVFVRINSKGKKLNQSDFILTLMSVFWEDGRKALETFSRASRTQSTGQTPYNELFDPAPDQLLRVGVGVGFRRGRFQYVYSLLRGKDLETGEFSGAQRDRQFAILQSAQARVLDLQNWHDFLTLLPLAGVRSKGQITSQNALLMAYTLYLLGRNEFKVDSFQLKTVIAQWLFMSSLTARYTGGSAESAMEADLAALRDVKTSAQYLLWLDGNIKVELTSDFWSITLPSRLRTSAARGPALFAWYAALVLMDAKVLFSKKKVADLLAPGKRAKRKGVERHHLFPRAYLKKELGLRSIKEINRIANLALVEWDDNAAIIDKPPAKYIEQFTSRFSGEELAQMYYWHGLPSDWCELEYDAFLEQREKLIAKVVKDGFYQIGAKGAPASGASLSLQALLEAGEGMRVEYKSTLRTNLHTMQHDPKVELMVLKTIAGFMNASGGHLVIGVDDSRTVLGLEADGFPSEDKMTLHLVNLVRERIGAHNSLFWDSHYEALDDKQALIVTCRLASKPVFVHEAGADRFYIRVQSSTQELTGSHAQHYIESRF